VKHLTTDQAISVVRQAMKSAGVDPAILADRSLAVGLRTLRRRLWALQSLGGRFAAVAASKHLEAMLHGIEADRSVA
jgi:hypothetical protein